MLVYARRAHSAERKLMYTKRCASGWRPGAAARRRPAALLPRLLAGLGSQAGRGPVQRLAEARGAAE